ncbi:unnamed protein product, partial [Coregonus sp. 'balchen']
MCSPVVGGRESKASLHYIHRLQRKALHAWISYVHLRQAKRKPQDRYWILWQQRLEEAEDGGLQTQITLVHYRQRQYTWAFYTWWGHSEERKEQKLAERMALLHEERSCLSRAWDHWQWRARQEREKRSASDTLYRHTLLHNTLSQWKDNEHLLQTQQVNEHVEERYSLHQHDFMSQPKWIHSLDLFIHHILLVIDFVIFLTDTCITSSQEDSACVEGDCSPVGSSQEQRAEKHYQHCVQAKVTFRRWRDRSREVVEESTGMEKAKRHHHHSLLCSMFRLWTMYQQQSYKLQHRRREAEQIDLALWHWCWRLSVAEQHRKQERLAQAAQFYRDQLLMEGVAQATHMGSFCTNIALHSQEQPWRRGPHPQPYTDSVAQGAGDRTLNHLAATTCSSSTSKTQSSTTSTPGPSNSEPPPCCSLPPHHSRTGTASAPASGSWVRDSSLLPPNEFTILHQQPESDVEDVLTEEEDGVDPTLAWTRELLNIRLDMQCFQQDRKQLQLEEVLRSWLQTSGSEGETEERNTISQELDERWRSILAGCQVNWQSRSLISTAAQPQDRDWDRPFSADLQSMGLLIITQSTLDDRQDHGVPVV